jgi:hypothetical protein
MNSRKIIFVLCLVGILFLIFLGQTVKQSQVGVVESVQYFNNKIIIELENSLVELVIFDVNFLGIEKGDRIKFQGRFGIYDDREQIIVDKLYLLSG